MDLVIKGGKIITASDTYNADIGIKDEKIDTIARNIEEPADRTIDASGKYVFPGMIDAHTHFELPSQGAVSGDDFETGTKAAACGGVTTICDFAIQARGQPILETIEKRREVADPKVHIDYSLHVAPTDVNDDLLKEIPGIVEKGMPSFKLFMTYHKEGFISEDGALFAIMQEARKNNAIVGIHAENDYLLKYLIEKFAKEGKTQTIYHARSRPNYVEAECISRGIRWSEIAGNRFYIFHISTREGVWEVASARAKGLPVFGETCPSYLFFNEDKYKDENGPLYVITPPLRTALDQEFLWMALQQGIIQVVSSAHCPFQVEEKMRGKDDFRNIPNGLPGVETTLMLLHNDGVLRGRFDFQHLVAIHSYNPAVIFGMYPRKGTIAVGSDADLVIFDPEKEYTMSYKTLHMNVNYSPYEGKKIKGMPVITISRGEVIYENGEFTGKPGHGKFLERHLPEALPVNSEPVMA
ncbi:MAG: dihydropyrimidinase [Candidatus Eremiobacteraeota bacterium]|nr:dihydropyrimidinase [Candidatus Eremiobacteraeota bacterium]